jgi:hypothetical protein
MKDTKTPLIWISKDKESKILNLKQLLSVLMDIKQSDIDSTINKNLKNLISWLEKEFPEQIVFISRLKTESKEYTSQQIRERLIRDLREIAS